MRSTLLLPLVVAGVVAVALAAAAVTFLSSRSDPSPRVDPAPAPDPVLAAGTTRVVQRLLPQLQYRDGEWMPHQYATSQWEKYQDAAVASAALGMSPNGTQGERTAAIRTVDTAIARHQLPNGDFNAGTPTAGSSSVSGGFWVEDEGLIALSLRSVVPSSTLRRWEQSVTRYAQFLERSRSAAWYSNGNVVLRQTVILLEAYRLATLVADPAANDYRREYEAEKQFLVSPSRAAGSQVHGAWKTYGEYTNGHGGLWFDESPASAPNQPIQCANGQRPCRGFDANYATVQLADALLALKVGGDAGFWRRVVAGEYAVLRGRVNDGHLNASAGSRYNIPAEAFYPPIYAVVGGRDARRASQQQLAAITSAVEGSIHAPNGAAGNVYSLLAPLALPLVHTS